MGERWEGEPAEHGAAIPTAEERSPESAQKGKLAQHGSPGQATCSHGVAGTQQASACCVRFKSQLIPKFYSLT